MSEESIIPKEQGIVTIATSIEDLKHQMALFQKLKTDLLTDDDIQNISNKKYVKKSGWIKYALAFNLKTEIIKEEKEIHQDKPDWYAYHFTIRCTATNGRITEKVGSCDNVEKPQAAMHVIRAMAETRATSRAISALIGAGEVSAEEMENTGDITASAPQHTTPEPVAAHYLQTLKDLGYTGIPPKTSFEAANIIAKLKSESKSSDDGKTPGDAKKEDYKKYCICEKFVENSLTGGKTCQNCMKLKPEENN
jgi:hypothetical protein